MNELSQKALELIFYLTETRTKKISTVLAISASFYVIRKILNRNTTKLDQNLVESLERNNKEKGKNKGHVDKYFFKNVVRLLKVCIPGILTKESGSFFILAGTMIGRTFLSIYMADITSDIVKSIVKKDLSNFMYLILVLAGLSLPGAFMNSLIDYLQKQLSLYFRENLCNYLQDKMFENNCYYKLTNLDSRIRNPDQVYTSDIEKFSNSLSALFINFSKPLLDIIFFTRKLSQTIGWGGPSMLIGWYVASGILMRFITPPFGKLAALEQSKFLK